MTHGYNKHRSIENKTGPGRKAYHKLMIGEKEVTVSVGSFGSTTYNQASRTALESYISSLKSQIAAAEGTPTCRRRIMKVSF